MEVVIVFFFPIVHISGLQAFSNEKKFRARLDFVNGEMIGLDLIRVHTGKQEILLQEEGEVILIKDYEGTLIKNNNNVH